MPRAGKKQKTEDIMEITHQEGEFDDDEEMEEEFRKFLKIQLEKRERIKDHTGSSGRDGRKKDIKSQERMLVAILQAFL